MKSVDLSFGEKARIATKQKLPFYKSRQFWRRFNLVVSLLIAGSGAFVILIPFLFMLSTSLKNPTQTVQFPPIWIAESDCLAKLYSSISGRSFWSVYFEIQ